METVGLHFTTVGELSEAGKMWLENYYREMVYHINVGEIIDRRDFLNYLVDRQYQRNV